MASVCAPLHKGHISHSGRGSKKFDGQTPQELDVFEVGRFVKGAYTHFAVTKAQVVGAQGRDWFAVHLHLDQATRRVKLQPRVIPLADFIEGGRPVDRTYAHTFSAEDVEDAVVDRLLGGRVARKMRVVEVRRITISEDEN